MPEKDDQYPVRYDRKRDGSPGWGEIILVLICFWAALCLGAYWVGRHIPQQSCKGQPLQAKVMDL
jgi:hypothetical protein